MSPTYRKRSGIQLAYPMEEKRLLRWNEPVVLTQPKLDGERCRAVRLPRNDTVLLLSSTEELITSVPHINEFLEQHWPQDMPPELELDGELYVHGRSFEQIHSVVSRTVNLHEDYLSMQLHCFDLVLSKLANAEREVLRLRGLPAALNDPSGPIRQVSSKLTEGTPDAVIAALREFHGQGYEGVIVRHPFAPYERRRSTNMMKFKPRKRDSYKIVGFTEELSQSGYPKNRLGALILEVDGETFRVGTGFTDLQRELYWRYREELLGCQCIIDYQSLTPGRRVPKFQSFVDIPGLVLKNL